MIKKFFTVVVISLLFFNIAFAQTGISTSEDLLNKQLQVQIQALQKQIVDLKAEVQSVKLELKLTRALAQGATGDDVTQLQNFLKTFTGSYPDGLVTGYFGPRTKEAVKKFQEQNGIESIGIVGPKTKKKLNTLVAAIPTISATPAIIPSETYAGETAPAQPTGQTTTVPASPTTPSIVPYSGTEVQTQTLPTARAMPVTSATLCRTPIGVQIQPDVVTVLSPNGGEKWQVGGIYTIKYSAKDTVGNKALLIYLEKGYDAPSTKIGVNSSQLIGVTTNLESYTYTVPSNIQTWPGLGNNYKITIMVEGSYSSCGVVSYIGDSSDAEFSIVAGKNNVPPATSAGPTTLGGSTSTTTIPTSGGGYGVSATPVTTAPIILTTQDKAANIQAQIISLQEKVNTSTEAEMRDSLMAQIAALKTNLQASPTPIPQDKIQILYSQQSILIKQFNSATDATIRNSLWAQMTALSEQLHALTPAPTTQDQINALLEEISAVQEKLNRTTDVTARDSLIEQIIALKERIQSLERSPTTPSTPTPPTSFSSTLAPTSTLEDTVSTTTSTSSTSVNVGDYTVQDLLKQINSLQSQLNITTNTLTRDYLITRITSLKAQVKVLQGY